MVEGAPEVVRFSCRVPPDGVNALHFAVLNGEHLTHVAQDSPADKHVSLIPGQLPLVAAPPRGVAGTLVVAEPGLERYGLPLSASEELEGAELYARGEEYWSLVRIRGPLPSLAGGGWFRVVTAAGGASDWRPFRGTGLRAARMALEEASAQIVLDSGHVGSGVWGRFRVAVPLEPPRTIAVRVRGELCPELSGYRFELGYGDPLLASKPMLPGGRLSSDDWIELDVPRLDDIRLVLTLVGDGFVRFVPIAPGEVESRLTVELSADGSVELSAE